jgi:two-component sensor histidine kinase
LEPTSQNAFPEGTLLMQELSHRINNELASAINAISLAAARSGSSDVKAVLANVSERLHSYADVHRTLQVPEHQTYIDAAQYLRQLCLSISRSKLESNNIRLVLAVRPLSMSSERCWRLGLIVYELVTNSARHAFNGTEGEVWVELWPAGHFVECRVSDNGTTRQRFQHGRGLTIVQQLVRCLNGRLEQSFGPQGSSSILVFPFQALRFRRSF